MFRHADVFKVLATLKRILRVQFNRRTPVFQTGGAGSIPVTRSTYESRRQRYSNTLCACFYEALSAKFCTGSQTLRTKSCREYSDTGSIEGMSMASQVTHCGHFTPPSLVTKPQFGSAQSACRMCCRMLCPGMRDSH